MVRFSMTTGKYGAAVRRHQSSAQGQSQLSNKWETKELLTRLDIATLLILWKGCELVIMGRVLSPAELEQVRRNRFESTKGCLGLWKSWPAPVSIYNQLSLNPELQTRPQGSENMRFPKFAGGLCLSEVQASVQSISIFIQSTNSKTLILRSQAKISVSYFEGSPFDIGGQLIAR